MISDDKQQSYSAGSLGSMRNILLISFGAFIWSIYLSIQGQFLNDYIADMVTYTPLKISLMVSLVAMTGAFASIIFGAISDNLRIKFGRRKPFIIIGGVFSAIFFFLLPFPNAVAAIIAINVVMSLFNNAAFVCNNSFIPDTTSKKKLGKVNSFAALGTSIGTVVGFAIMMINSTNTLFFVSGAICSLGFLIVGIFIQEPINQSEPKKWYESIKETFHPRSLKNEKGFFNFLISHFLLHTGINVYIPFLLIFLTQQNNPSSGELIGLGLSIESGEVLVIFAVMTVVSLLATIPIGIFSDRIDTSLFLLISRVVFAITTILLALTPLIRTLNPLFVGVLFIIPYGIANTADIISRGALMHKLAPKEKRGQFLGLTVFVKILAQIPGVIIGGLLAQFLQGGYQFAFVFGGVIVLLSLPFISFTKIRTPLIQETTEKSLSN